MKKPENDDWQVLRTLEEEVERTGQLTRTEGRWELLRRVARQTALPNEEAERLLQQSNGGVELVKETRRRIREGSRRLSRAIISAHKSKASGRLDEAKSILGEIIDNELVPFYREIAAVELRGLEQDEDQD